MQSNFRMKFNSLENILKKFPLRRGNLENENDFITIYDKSTKDNKQRRRP